MSDSAFSPVQSALRDFRYFESTDLDDTCERITNILQAHRLMPGRNAGHIRSHMDFLGMSGVGFGTIKYSNEMSVDVTGLDDYHVVIFCPAGHGTISTHRGTVEVGGSRGFVSNAGQTFRATFSAECEQFFLRFDRKLLAQHTGEMSVSLRPDVHLHHSAMAPWLRLVHGLFADREALEIVRGNPLIAAQYEQLLLGLFLEGHPHRTHGPAASQGIAPSAIRRAERYILEHYAEAVTLLDIARAAGVPTRTLLDNFRRFRNTSPVRFLHEVRLQQARALLLRKGANCTVSEIAGACGFTHVGRFAKEYFLRYGEYPSHSTARARRWRSRSFAEVLRAGAS
jgi:AraC-like DNA-binding protein